MKTVKQVLTEARELISDPERWTTGIYAVDADGNDVVSTDPKACKWCSIGAVYNKAFLSCLPSDEEYTLAARSESALRRGAFEVHKENAITLVNDKMGHGASLQMFDKAIELCDKSVE